MNNKKIIEMNFFKSIDFNKEKPCDLDTAMSCYAEGAVLELPPNPPIKGKMAIKEFFSRLPQRVAEVSHIIRRIAAEGDLVAVSGFAPHKSKDGKVIEIHFADFFEMKNGKITYHWIVSVPNFGAF